MIARDAYPTGTPVKITGCGAPEAIGLLGVFVNDDFQRFPGPTVQIESGAHVLVTDVSPLDETL